MTQCAAAEGKMENLELALRDREAAQVKRLVSIGRQMWAILVVVVAVSVGAARWATSVDMRLANMENALGSLVNGEIAKLKMDVERLKLSVAADILPEADKRLDRLESRVFGKE